MNPLNNAQTLSSADDFDEYPCDLCGSREAVELPRCREYTGGQPVHVCRQCGFVYVVKRRSADRIARVWSEEIFGSGYTAAIPAVLARLTYVAEFLKLHVPLAGKRLCEIGAGEGEFLGLMQRPEYGAIPFGIEPSAENGTRLTERGIPHFTGTVERYAEANPAAPAQFDVASILWTLENCQDCRRMLRLAHNLLAPGGHIVVATGSRLLVPFKKPLHAYLSSNPADTHAFRFSANTLRAILAVSGFATVQINRFLDHDILCVIARRDERASIEWQGDDYLEICNFFERWHVDTSVYFPDPLV